MSYFSSKTSAVPTYQRKIAKVFWWCPGQNGGLWRSKWNSNISAIPEIMNTRFKTGSNRAKNTANNLVDVCAFLDFECIVWVLGGSYCPKIVNLDFRTYCDIGWNIFGTSKNSTKYGPADPLFTTKHFNEYKNIPQTSLTNIICSYLNVL